MDIITQALATIRTFIAGNAINFIFSAICALVFILLGFKVSGWFVKKLKKSKNFVKMDESAASFICSCLNVVLKALIIVMAAAIVGIDVTALSAVFATIGVTVGLALQGSLSNLTGGLMLLIFRPFKVGDFIDNHSDSGVVREIGIFYTTLDTPDNKRITIPNGALSNATVVNYSAEDTRRVDMEFSVAYDSDIEKVTELLTDIARKSELVLQDPSPFVGLIRHDASALIFVVRAWTKNSDYWNVYFYLSKTVKQEFDKAGIEIPFNQLDVHLDK